MKIPSHTMSGKALDWGEPIRRTSDGMRVYVVRHSHDGTRTYVSLDLQSPPLAQYNRFGELESHAPALWASIENFDPWKEVMSGVIEVPDPHQRRVHAALVDQNRDNPLFGMFS